MSKHDPVDTSLMARCFAAIFSGVAAGLTYCGWVIFHSRQWGPEQIASVKEFGIWVVLAGAALGFIGGISLTAWIWSELWDTNRQPLISMRTGVALLVLGSIIYGVFKFL
jgi:hypothetical protein